ncbi:guanylate-binding protein 2-like [Porites lutea]|uniref:guanylate-binding protein 2-like n=1 Tax=Porites lutea TaxID=51062 RepID=UPI003CC66CED
MVLKVVLGIIFAASFSSGAEGREAKVLLKVTDNKTYELVEDVLKELTEIERPIRVLAAVGNARVGKSTTLNLINHIWDGREKGHSVEEIFKTGDSSEQVTRNVWAHTIHRLREDGGSIVLLDVEGFDLGDDKVTEHLSMFTAMMSSCLTLFANDYLGNNDRNFLYYISRLSDLVFSNSLAGLRNFPTLHIVIRGNLKYPEDIESYIRDKFFRPNHDKNIQGMVDTIERYFKRDGITVSQIPNVNEPEILQDTAKLRNKSFWNSVEKLMAKLQNCPKKKFAIGGSPMDGQALVDLANDVVKAMNENSWAEFGDVYFNNEKGICQRSYEKHLRPVLQFDSKGIVDYMMEAIENFRTDCKLESEIKSAREELKKTLNEKRKQEEERRKQEEAEERRRKEEEERRNKENWYSYGWYVAGLLGGYLVLFSDENLKSNVTVLLYSIYNDIGLTGVCWKWNDNAQQKFGLTGEACGVIAQQVQKLYPEAVLVGEDGFLQVRYGILHKMINHVRDKRC